MEQYEENVYKIAFSAMSQYIGAMSLKRKGVKRLKVSWLLLILIPASIVWLLNVSRPGTELIACPDTCAKKVDHSDEVDPIHILSLNMLHGFPNFTHLEERTSLLSAEIGRLGIDIVLLQEVPWTNEHGQIAQQLAEQHGFNYVYLRANGNRKLIGFEEGLAILSQYPLKNLSFTELRPVAGFFENRMALHATAETPQGNIDLFVTHLTNGKASINASQTESLLSFVQKEAQDAALVAGDFNAVADSPQILHLTNVWQDSFHLLNPNDSGASCCVTDLSNSPASELQVRVDYVFMVPGTRQLLNILAIEQVFAEPFAVANGRLWLSDHAGLLATVTIEQIP